jgi:hypothetical protein
MIQDTDKVNGRDGSPMTSPRNVLAVSLALGTLVVTLAVMGMGGALRAGLAPWPGIAVVAMAIAAYVLPREEGSLPVAGLLLASGTVNLGYGLAATEFLTAATFPGPIFGVVIGAPMLAVGVATGVQTARSRAGLEHIGRSTHVQSVLTRIFTGLAWSIVAGIAVQFYLAGAAMFGAMTFEPHRALGVVLAAAILLLLILALVARPGRRLVGLTALRVGLTVVQLVLPSLRTGLPWVAALHALVAVAIGAQAAGIARGAPRATEASSAPEPTANLRDALRGASQ